MKHYSFPKIRQYHQVLRDLKLHHQYVGKDEIGNPIFDSSIKLPVVDFVGHTKLHGTNSSIVFSYDGSFYCQSRENVIDEVKDNAGFAHWVNKEGKGIFDLIKHHFDGWDGKVVLYGEWCGGSIQKGVALNELPKMFVVFGGKKVCIVDAETSEWFDTSQIQDHSINVYNITEAPQYRIWVDLERPDKAIEQMTAWVDEIDVECPFAKMLGVSGHGEGIVFREATKHSFDNAFKVKGESHSKSKIKKLPTVDVVKMDGIQEAVETHCHEDRMQQIYDKIVLTEADKVPQKIGDFIRLLIEDAWEEEGDSIRASDISRKEFGAAVSKKAARWFQSKISEF
jgi:hypothetical protein